MTAAEQSAVLFVFLETVRRFESLKKADSNHYCHQLYCSCVSLLCEGVWPTVSPGQIDECLKDEPSLSLWVAVCGELIRRDASQLVVKRKWKWQFFVADCFINIRVDIFRIGRDVFCNNSITFHLIVCLRDI